MPRRWHRRILDLALPLLGLVAAAASIASYSTVIHRANIARLPSNVQGADSAEPSRISTYYADFDGYYYVSYARQLVDQNSFRVRSTNLDNAPHGRPVHWASLFCWWLIALGAIRSGISGEALMAAIGDAAYAANPILLGVLLTIVAIAVTRRLGGLAACATVVLLSTNDEVLWEFSYARPDHHGLIACFALGTLLCAILGGGGWVSLIEQADQHWPNRVTARRWFIASGVLGGCGLWVSAAQMSVVIAALGLGAALAFALIPGDPRKAASTRPASCRNCGDGGRSRVQRRV
jgi:asparagine N-glycosylation enzyme membrane subunit Stt3